MTAVTPLPAPDRASALHLDTAPGRLPSTIGGSWAPQSSSLTTEVPGLVEELHRRGIRIVRIAYNPTRWDATPRTVPADGRTIHLGLFRTLAPDLLILQGTWGERVDLTVPPRVAP